MTVPPTSKKGSGMFDGHSVVLVGYRRRIDYPGGGYFVLRNHWGSGWGAAGAAVDLVARDPSKLDAFVDGTDGRTYTAAVDQNVTNGQWRGWWNILTGQIPLGGGVADVMLEAIVVH